MQQLINDKSATALMLLVPLLLLLSANNASSFATAQKLKEQEPTEQTKVKDIAAVLPEPAATDSSDVDNMVAVQVLPDEISDAGARAGECFQIGEHCTLAEQCCTMRCQNYLGKCVS